MSTRNNNRVMQNASIDPDAAIAQAKAWNGVGAIREDDSDAASDAARTWGGGDREQRLLNVATSATRQQAAPQPQTVPQQAPQPAHRAARWPVDGMKLSPEDYRRRLAQLGISSDGIDLMHGPMGASELEDTWARESSRQQVDRAGRALDRHRSHEQRPAFGAFDARTASPPDIARRLESMGIAPDPSVSFRDVGTGEQASRAATAHAVVSAAIDLAERTGQRLDVMRFSEAELDAYKRIKGIGGGYEPAR
jgi:Fe2+ transport system protein FeoA